MSFRLKIALGAGLLLVSAGAASAATGTATTALNVRSGPGGSYPVIDTLPAGEIVNLLDCTGGWCEISMGADGTGFASESFLDIRGGGPARERVVIERSEPRIVTGLSIGGYWGETPYYYDDGYYYYGGRWYDEQPGRPGWERSWRRDHRRGEGPRRDRDASRDDRREFRGDGGRDQARPSRAEIDRGSQNRDRRTRDAVDPAARSSEGARRAERIETPRVEREAPRVEQNRDAAPAARAPADRGDRVGLDRAR